MMMSNIPEMASYREEDDTHYTAGGGNRRQNDKISDVSSGVGRGVDDEKSIISNKASQKESSDRIENNSVPPINNYSNLDRRTYM